MAGPEAADPEVADPEVADHEVFPGADAAEPQASSDTVLLFDVLVPAFAVGAEVDNPALPSVFGFPNVDYLASPSNSAEVVG